jgi:hypothetical protein
LALAVPAVASAAPGAIKTADDENYGSLFMDASQSNPLDNSVTINPGEKVTFSYPSGNNVHNVAFTNIGPLPPTCVQTAASPGIPIMAAPPLPAFGQPANFGAFTPSLDKDYTASTTARAIATSGDATLTVADPSSTATGFLTNGDYTLPSPLQVKATSAIGGGGGTFANVGSSASPTQLLSYPRALNDAAITLDFKQHVNATDALRAGRYSKTLTFTLATVTP